jgi:hypothetical protein
VAPVRTYVSDEHSASVIIRSLRQFLVTGEVVLSSPILVTLMIEVLRCSETSGLTRAIRRNVPEHSIFHSHRRVNLKSYTSSYLASY